MTDLQAKYQKLAAEYSKLRAQLPVLKKAVLDEQANEEQLKESVKEKDQAIRKFEQEVDSLTFRNQQLASRVSMLQKELEDIQSFSKKHKKNSTVALPDSRDIRTNAGVVDEELRNKIEENARLHKQVFESDQEHRNEVTRLQDRLSTLEAEAMQHESVLSSITTINKEKIGKLQEEKAMLEVKIQKQERDTREALQRSADLDEQLTKIKDELGTQLEDVLTIVHRKLPFNDSADKKLNALNVPCHNHQHQLQARELISQADVLIRDLVQGFIDFYTYSEERAKVFVDIVDQGTLSEVNKKFCQHLRSHKTILPPIKQSFQQLHESVTDDGLVLLETVTGLQSFASCWQNFIIYVQKLLPYQLLSLEGECALTSCPSTLASKNMEYHGSMQLLVSNLIRADSYISLLAAQSSGNNGHPASSHASMFSHLSRALIGLHESMKDLSRHFNAKVSLEHQLPTAAQKLKVADEFILSALVSLVTVSGKISAFFSGNLSFFIRPSNDRPFIDPIEVAANPAVAKLRQRATEYMTLINRPPSDSVPYLAALQNRRTVYSFTESKDSLTQQIVTLQERLGRLEQEREHWMLETQLMQMKYQKEAQKVTAIQKGDQKTICNDSKTSSSVTRPSQESSTCGVINTSMLGHVDVVATGDRPESEMREQLISSHFQHRVSELTLNLQMADSKALHFYAECRALQKRLTLCQKEKEKMQDELYQSNQTVAQLKDELQTTTRSYEGQLSMMSDHLAGMNERLTTQKDEIDMLRYQLQQTVKPTGKKGKTGK